MITKQDDVLFLARLPVQIATPIFLQLGDAV